MSRLTRKEIKRDEVMETVGTAFDYARDHSKTILYAVVGLIALAVGIAGTLIYLSARSDRASEALAEALAVQQAPIDAAAASPDDPDSPSFPDEAARRARAREAFDAVRSDYGRTDAADVAAAYLGRLAAAEGDLAAARAYWEEFVDRQDDHALALEVRLNLMELDRVEGRSEELVVRLQGMVDDPRAALPAPLVLQQLALTLERLGRTQEAVDTYRRLVEEHPLSALVADARTRAESLEAELAG